MRFAEGRRGTSPHPLHLLFYCWLVLRFDSFHREEKGTLIPPRVVDKILDPLCVCVCVCARASGVPRIFRLALWTCARARTTREDKELCARARELGLPDFFSSPKLRLNVIDSCELDLSEGSTLVVRWPFPSRFYEALKFLHTLSLPVAFSSFAISFRCFC